MSSQLSTIKIVLKFLLISISFYLFLPVSEVYAGATINKAPTSLGLISGLVGYWSFDGPDIGETDSGTIAFDRSGQGNDGRFTNCGGPVPKRAIGRIGQALNFSSCSSLTGPTGGTLSNLPAVSISVWIKPSTVVSATTQIVDRGSGTTGWSLQMSSGAPGNLDFLGLFPTNTVGKITNLIL